MSVSKNIAESFSAMLAYRSVETAYHSQRVADLAFELARAAGIGELEATRIRIAAALHDIGKIAIPEKILNKAARLEADEEAVVRTHTTVGYNMLKISNEPIPRLAAQIALSHHERWDGTGYPQALSGLRIPREARITAIADVFDALTHDRPYKPAWPVERALDYILEKAGSQFDPELARIFVAFMGVEPESRAFVA